jgi:two-component system sensor histidine kinase VicK
MKKLLTSDEPAYIGHYNSVFEELWKNGVDAIQRIKDMEAGVDLADVEVIPSSARAQELYLNIVKGASEEILWIFPTASAFIRQEKIGAIQLAKEAAKQRNVKVRIMIPTNGLIEQKVQQLKQYCYPNNIIDVRYIVPMSETKATILVDRKASLVMEIKDDSKTTFDYQPILIVKLEFHLTAIFENLWKQTELYDQLKEVHERLKIHDKMQEEFINVAAHELRTPIQPILGLSEVLRCNAKDPKQRELLDVTIRNAKRLQQLTNDILDVTKIESQSLNLNKEQFNLNDVITNAIDDIMTNRLFSSSSSKTNNSKNAIKLLYHQLQDVFVYADKGRITQVISNLLDNAVKFTKDEGTITVMVEKKEKEELNNNAQQVIVSIKDTGEGIDPQILPRLFTKFATKSQTGGTGLGLFICKGIVEAHGGNMRAENNSDGKGATFSFSLPLANNNKT